MVLISSYMVPLGTPAVDFTLPSSDGTTLRLRELTGAPALLIIFACNHCNFVRHLESAIGAVVDEFPSLAAVAITANDLTEYPEDGFDGMAAQKIRAGWNFPYVLDESQSVAKSYKAVCTPDFFLYNADQRLAYRGAFDESTPGNGKPVKGDLLREAIGLVLDRREVPEPHQPSMGCSIKYRPGNEPFDAGIDWMAEGKPR